MPNGKFEDLELYPPPDSSDYDEQDDYLKHGMDWLIHTVYFLAERQNRVVEGGCVQGKKNLDRIHDLEEVVEKNQEVVKEVRKDKIEKTRIDKLWDSIGSSMKIASAVFGTLAAMSFIAYNVYYLINK